ncbi:rhodanese-like domain-containing protein [Mucilaginibacter paludis]|uniref:Rhodanese-like protein n=1 Tax=Mucilaginibacter paludis DSM 18603 TaxID=714943 RepID=H1YD29_9SPHI|nr:rhodanese-like domain-containing protein [Mucilaginibacter paludis]EHQ26086.1 Rhodanese-like protein [Mucilaginibacter paludis DSM 18603]
MEILKRIFGLGNQIDLAAIITKDTHLVDVRTPAEFAGGHVKGSVNIPLDQLQKRLSEFKNKKSIVVFCQSGNRSQQAKTILEKNNIPNVTNGGSWTTVKQFVK